MKWKNLVEGQKRCIKKFAYLRQRLSNGDLIWLETFYIEQIATKNSYDSDARTFICGWENRLLFQYENMAQEMLARKAGEIK